MPLRAIRQTNTVDNGWLIEQCDRLSEVLTNASEIRTGATMQSGPARIEAA